MLFFSSGHFMHAQMYILCLYTRTRMQRPACTHKTSVFPTKPPLQYYSVSLCLFTFRLQCFFCIYFPPDFISSWKLKIW